jgi:ankyrin repeat protein
MVEAIIADNRGFLLINSIDKNNDSPAHLAAFRGHFEILTILAKNNAFLDQPNAESKDPIATIVSDDDRIMMVQKFSAMKLSEKNTKHIANVTQKLAKVIAQSVKNSSSLKSGVNATNPGGTHKPSDIEESRQKSLTTFHKVVNGMSFGFRLSNLDKIKIDQATD